MKNYRKGHHFYHKVRNDYSIVIFVSSLWLKINNTKAF